MKVLFSFFIVIYLNYFHFAYANVCDNYTGYKRDPNDCQTFYYCAYGVVLGKFMCPGELFFNEKIYTCDSPINVDCKMNQTVDQTDKPVVQTEKPVDNQMTNERETIDSNEIEDDANKNGKKMVVCYYSNWSTYRKGKGKFLPEDINPVLCTHLIYAFTTLNEATFSIKVHDHWLDVESNYYKRVVALKKKNKQLKVMIAIGGWNDSEFGKYSKMVSSEENRKKFIKSIMEFLDKYSFDGLDLDWEYPGCPQGKCSNQQDKNNFAKLVKELKDEFKSENYLLSAAVSASKSIIDYAYDVPALAKYLDFLNIMLYDLHGQWNQYAGHHAAFYSRPESASFDPDDKILNVDYVVKYWASKGFPKFKMTLGIPLYGRTVRLLKSTDFKAPYWGFGAALKKESAPAGEFTGEPGFLAYYEICDYLEKGFKKFTDKYSGPYISNPEQFVSYDDVSQIMNKAKYINDNGLAGGMIWVTDTDDFKGKCCNIKYPLLKALNRGLNGGKLGKLSKCP